MKAKPQAPASPEPSAVLPSRCAFSFGRNSVPAGQQKCLSRGCLSRFFEPSPTRSASMTQLCPTSAGCTSKPGSKTFAGSRALCHPHNRPSWGVGTAHIFRLAELDHGGARPTMLCGFVGNMQLVLNGPEAPRDSEWTSYQRSVLPYGHAVTIGLVHTLGGGPNPAQRQETTKFRQTHALSNLRYAILTDVAFHRAFINVVNLFERVPFRAFPSREVQKALAYLGGVIPEAEVRRHFAYMAGLLGIAGYSLPPTPRSQLSSVAP